MRELPWDLAPQQASTLKGLNPHGIQRWTAGFALPSLQAGTPAMTDTPLKLTKDVQKYAAEQAISEVHALKQGIEEPSAARWTIRRIAREGEAKRSQKYKGAKVYAKA